MNEVLTDYGYIDPNIITSFAEELGVRFPREYIELLSQHNGLQFTKSYFDYIGNTGKSTTASFGFCGYDRNVVCDAIEDMQDFDIYGYDGVIAFGLRGNGDYICFDYRANPTTDNPPVVLMYHDQYENDVNGDPKMSIVPIAKNFEDFINMLHD